MKFLVDFRVGYFDSIFFFFLKKRGLRYKMSLSEFVVLMKLITCFRKEILMQWLDLLN